MLEGFTAVVEKRSSIRNKHVRLKCTKNKEGLIVHVAISVSENLNEADRELKLFINRKENSIALIPRHAYDGETALRKATMKSQTSFDVRLGVVNIDNLETGEISSLAMAFRNSEVSVNAELTPEAVTYWIVKMESVLFVKLFGE